MKILTGTQFRILVQGATIALEAQKQAVNDLNVFPVPDGDTGTNMLLTVQAAQREVAKKTSDDLPVLAQALAYGALMGARGNSGVILSQLLRGLQEGVGKQKSLDGKALAKALIRASEVAYQAVVRPVEGTILTVARDAAKASLTAANQGGDVLAVLAAYLNGAKQALEQTPKLLAVLREAGVVDAGGMGLVVLAEGALAALQDGVDLEKATLPTSKAPVTKGQTTPLTYTYCTEFLIQGEDLPQARLREQLSKYGDSLLVVGDSQVTKVHVHSNHPGQVLEYCLQFGQLTEIHINNMALQNAEFNDRIEGAEEPATVGQEPSQIRLLPVTVGEGLSNIFRSLGAAGVIEGGQTMNPATEELLAGVEALPPGPVILLPNNKNIILTAKQVVTLTEREAVVVPSKTIPQGIAAMLAYNPEADIAANVATMTTAIGAVKTGEITYAVRNTRYNGLEIAEQDIIGLMDGELVVAGKTRPAVALDLIERLATEATGFITIYYGLDVTRGEVEELVREVHAHYPDYEVEVHFGGQPIYAYILSVE